MSSASSSTAKFGATLKSIGANIGIMLAITLAVKAASAAWDYFNVTVEETQEKIDGINSRISELKSEVEQLDSVQFKTTQQEVRLSNLERELDLQEKLLEIEQRRYYQELTGNGFTDGFDASNLNTIYEKEKIGYDNSIYYSEYGQLKQDYTDLKKLIADVDEELANTTDEEKKIKLEKERVHLLEEQTDRAIKLSEKELEYYGYYQQAQNAVDSGLLLGEDLRIAEELAEKWRLAYEEAKMYSTSAQKSAGTYSYTSEIEGILEKADFDGIKEQLTDLAKEGILSDDVLSKRFPELIDYLKTAGIEAQTLIGYIMQMSNPDAINYTEAKSNLIKSITGGGNAISSDVYKQLEDAGMFTEESLEAYLRIIATLDTSSFTEEDWIHEIQEEVDKNPIEVRFGEPSTIASSVRQIASQLEPQFNQLGEAYQNIFTADGFTLDNVDNTMLENLRKSFAEIESEIGVVFDSSQLNSFFDALTDKTGTVEEQSNRVQQAFNDIATAYFYSTDTISKLNEDTADSMVQQLEKLGVSNAVDVVSDALEKYGEALKFAEQNSFDLGDATTAQIASLAREGQATDEARIQLFYYTLQKQLASNTGLSTAEECQNLINLATQTQQTAQVLEKFINILNIINSDSWGDATKELAKKELNKMIAEISAIDVEYKNTPSTTASAGKAGKDAGEAYKDALEEELNNLGDVISYVGDIIGEQTDLWQDQKNAAVDSLNAQKEAAEDALEAQIDLVEEQIEAIENQIELKEKEIEKIQDARKERDLELASQKALADWNRRLSQKNRFIYKEGNDGVPGQMVYEHDIKGIRDAKEEYDRTQEDLEINRIEKEIKILEDEISGLEDIIDGLNEQIEASNKYYDDLISQTEKYYDSMIQGLEDYKSRWEELANIEKEAKMQVALKNLGIETTDILNMSEEAFNAFKNQYLSILTQMYNGETDMINAINSVAQGIDMTTLESGLTKTKENIDKLNSADFTSVKTGLDSVSTGMTSVGNSASTASEGTTAVSDDLQKMNQSTEGLDTKLSGIATALDSIPTREKFDGLSEACSSLGEAIERISKALGVSDGSVSGLVTALQEISTVSLMGEDGEGGIISQFQSLKTAVDEVTSAINGGGAMNTEATAGTTASPSRGGEGEQGGGAGGLTGAIKEIGTTTDETMGAGGSEGGEGSASSEGGEGEGVLGKFSAFKDSVDAVTKAIGTGEEEEGSEEGASTLIGALQLHYEKAEETLPQVKSRFEELLESITACVEKLSELAGAMTSLGGGGGGGGKNSFSLFAKGTDPNVSFSGMVGKAFAKGTGRFKGLSKDEPLAITSEYGQPETIIPPDGNAMITTSPTAMSLKKGTVILNEEQTKEMLNNNPEPVYRELGKKTFELGVDYDIVDGRPKFKTYLNPDDFANRSDYFDEMMSRFNFSNTFEASKEAFTKPLYSIEDKLEKMTEQISNVNNNYNNNQSVSVGEIHVHCSGITSEDVGREAGAKFYEELNRATIGLPNAARQHNTTIGKVY